MKRHQSEGRIFWAASDCQLLRNVLVLSRKIRVVGGARVERDPVGAMSKRLLRRKVNTKRPSPGKSDIRIGIRVVRIVVASGGQDGCRLCQVG